MALSKEAIQALKRGEFRNGWPLLLACAAILFFVSGAHLYTMPFIYRDIVKTTEWTREQVTLLASIKALFGAASALWFGRLLDIIGDRKGLIIAAVANLAAVGMMYFATTLWVYYLVGVAMGLTGPGVMAAAKIFLTRSFAKNSGTAVGIGFLGSSLAGVVVPLVVVFLMARFDWRTTLLLMTLGGWLVAVPLFLWATRNTPDAREPVVKDSNAPKITRWQLFKAMAGNRSFQMIALAVFLIGCVDQGLIQHNVLFLEADRGIDRSVIAGALSIGAMLGFVSRLGFGWLYDRLSVLGVAIAYGLLVVDPLIALTVVGPITATAFIAIRALGHGALMIDDAVLSRHVFGTKNLGTLIGVFTSCSTLGAAVGPFILGRVHTLTGSYNAGFVIFAVMALVACLLVSRVTPSEWLKVKAAKAEAAAKADAVATVEA